MKLAKLIACLAVLVACVWIGWEWTINRVYVPQGYSLQLLYKGPFIGSGQQAEDGNWAQDGEIGVRRQLKGPGRHFYNPIWWKRELVPDVVIKAGEVGVVSCKIGLPLPNSDDFLVDGDIGSTRYKGILRKALAPGRYRVNPYGYKVTIVQTETNIANLNAKQSGWVNIPTGYVGVVTNLASNPVTGAIKGVQEDVLSPGIYLLNGREQQVDVVEIGYRETTLAHEKIRDNRGKLEVDEAGEPMIRLTDKGIDFPSGDGFQIRMDFTAIWGLMPHQAPNAVHTFGNVDAVQKKVVEPQVESICRNNGSKYQAVELLVGEDREKFQTQNLDEIREILGEKNITLLYGLIRHIYIPRAVREPIQSAFVADELALTREQEQLTAREEGTFRESEKNVELENERVVVDTERQFQSALAEGDREAKGIQAESDRLVANIKKETAKLKSQAQILLGKAENEGQQLIEEAKAERFQLAVEAFGSAEAYNNWIFATNLPKDVDLKLMYAGEGTLWTDMDNLGIRATIPINQKDKVQKTPTQKSSKTSK